MVGFVAGRNISPDRHRTLLLRPCASGIQVLRCCQCAIDLDTEITHGALDLGMAEQKLSGEQFLGSLVVQRCPDAPMCSIGRTGGRLTGSSEFSVGVTAVVE